MGGQAGQATNLLTKGQEIRAPVCGLQLLPPEQLEERSSSPKVTEIMGERGPLAAAF